MHESRLEKVFLDDHRTFTRLLYRLLKAVQANDVAGAKKLADEVDQCAGPHIEFEERVLYPEVGVVHGGGFEQRLRDEHELARKAVHQLLRTKSADIDDELRHQLTAALEGAVSHAESCGTLVSHLSALSPEKQSDALVRLETFRKAGHRWTELSRGPSGSMDSSARRRAEHD